MFIAEDHSIQVATIRRTFSTARAIPDADPGKFHLSEHLADTLADGDTNRGSTRRIREHAQERCLFTYWG